MRFYPFVFTSTDEGGIAAYYNYSADGERNFKFTSPRLNIQQNASLFNNPPLVYPTLYASSLITLTPKGYTKHYYAGADRVAARIGGGNLDHDTTCVGQDDDVVNRADELFSYCNNLVSYSEISHQNLDELIIRNIDNQEMWAMGTFKMDDMPVSLKTEMYPDVGNFPKMVEYFSQPNPHGNPQEDDEPEVYFYHSDHLGGASWITDRNGKPVQHLQYLPFGEPFVDQHPAGYQERFRFTGKERDEETGFGYFGARYMDHELMTMWLSVDPMSDKYPSISPYAYCAWNPVKLVDPDGRDFDPTMEKYASQVEHYCDIQIKYLSGKESLTDEQKSNLSELQSAKEEIQKMRDDKTTLYRLAFGKFAGRDADQTAGETTYSCKEPNATHRDVILVALNITNSPLKEDGSLSNEGLYTLAHELKHCYQFYNGETIYAKRKGERSEVSNTPELEKAAFRRGEAFRSPLKWEIEKNKPMYQSLVNISHEEFIRNHAGCEIIRHKK